MISVMNKEFEFEKKSDGLDRALEHAADSSNHDENVSDSRVVHEARVSLTELDPGVPGSEFDAKMLGNGRSAEFRVFPSEEVRFLVSSDGEGGDPGMDMEFSSSLVDVEISKTDGFDAQNDENANLSQYKSLMSEFDDYVANDNSGAMVAAATSRAMSYGFEKGDLVWGKVKSHPWWPGHIFNDALATPSVRRTRREEHVLVAFFGDSSYGWFDPAELIPFEPNYYEKSRQTTSRTFLKAVEEAVDEASRRRGLGLACKCRNRYNFRPTNVEGYFAVDVPDFEAEGIYSWNQIRRSRESFKPGEILSFIKQLALTPRGGDHRSINFLNNKATVFGYRKSVYEEFDETYAQAFGASSGPGRPPRNSVASFDQHREPARAPPLSGPLVIAEALGGGKRAIKPMKMKDQSKKDRYLLKRRDESSNLRDFGANQEQETSTVPLSLVAESAETGGAEDYVLVKRTPTVPVKPHIPEKSEHSGFVGRDSETSSLSVPINEALIGQMAVGTNLVGQGNSVSVDASSDKGMILPEEPNETMAPSEVVSSRNDASSDMANERAFPRMLVDNESLGDEANVLGEARYAGTENILKSSETPQQPELSNSVNLEGGRSSDKNLDSYIDPELSSAGAKFSDGDSSIGGVVKSKTLKRPAEDMSSSSTLLMGEKKKKKKKRDIGDEMDFDHVQKQLISKKVGTLVGKVAEKSNQAGLGSREDFRLEHQKKRNTSTNNSISHAGVFGRGNDEFDVPQLLNDLHAFALDPYHGVEWNCHVIVQKFFLRFRSLVFQKSLVSSPPSEAESSEFRAAKSPDSSLGTDNLSENDRDSSSSNSVKPLRRRDEPTKAGRKRVPSDRLEEIAAKKLKKMSDLKSLASEKKTIQKLADSLKRESRDSVGPMTVKTVKRDSVKKLEPPSVRKIDPTMLVMKFPPETSLPSHNELKARFGRFGPIDQSGLRIFWKSSTCRVVFLYKTDAQAAYKYAMGNKSLFGNVNVKYQLREVGAPATDAPESEKGSAAADDNPIETTRMKDPSVLPGRASTPVIHQPPLPPLPAAQLKSCLKKSSGEESGVPSSSVGTGGGGGSSKGTTRVKFMLGGEESNRNNNMNANFADGGTSSSVAMDINSNNFFQKVVSIPTLPIPPQFIKPPHSIITTTTSTTTNIMHQQHSEMPQPPPRNAPVVAPLPPPPPPPPATTLTTDISQQLLSLLTRCSDVVTNVTGLLGYVPYHPL